MTPRPALGPTINVEHLSGARAGVPVLVPRPQRRRVHDRPVGGQVVPARRRRPDLDPGWRIERRDRRLIGDVPTGKILYSGGADGLSSVTRCAKEHRGDRSELSESDLAADRAHGQRAHLPHAHDARRRHCARGRRRARQRQPDRPERGQRRHLAKRDLEPDDRDVDDRRVDRQSRAGTTRPPFSCQTAGVLIAGSGHSGGLSYPGQNSAQIYSPPYLFNGPRPTITSAPASTWYGATFSVSTPDASSISSVNLVSLGTDTHQLDMGQHFVPLNFTQTTARSPSRAVVGYLCALPGNYMVFIVNASGVPSVASLIHIAAAPSASFGAGGRNYDTGNGTASVSWTAPRWRRPITSYTVTPYIGSTAQPPTTVNGPNPPTRATITGLTDGIAYTFTVSATTRSGPDPLPRRPTQSLPRPP